MTLTGGYGVRHETMMGSVSDPEDGKGVAGTIYTAVIVYVVCFPLSSLSGGWWSADQLAPQFFLVFCAGQAWLNSRQRAVQLQ